MLAFVNSKISGKRLLQIKSSMSTYQCTLIEQSVIYANWQVALYYSNRAVMYFIKLVIHYFIINNLEKNNTKTVYNAITEYNAITKSQ